MFHRFDLWRSWQDAVTFFKGGLVDIWVDQTNLGDWQAPLEFLHKNGCVTRP
jgi:hypothetical protein